MRVDSVHATRKKIAAVPTSATIGFGCRSRICSQPPDAIWDAVKCDRNQRVFGIVPLGGFVCEIGSAGFWGTQLSVPCTICCETPAAMKSEIPLPIPHFETTSSIRNTR